MRHKVEWVGSLNARGLGIDIAQALSAILLLGMAQVPGNDPSTHPLNKKQNMGDN